MNEGINLLDPNKKGNSGIFGRRLQTMRIVVIGLLFIVSVSSVILFILVDLSPLPTLQKQQQSLEQTFDSSKNDVAKLELVNERTDAITSFLSNRQMLDQTLGLIQSKISGNMTVTALQANNTGVSITVQSDSLEDIDNFLNGLVQLVQQKQGFSQATLVDLANSGTNDEYSATVSLNTL